MRIKEEEEGGWVESEGVMIEFSLKLRFSCNRLQCI